MESRQPVKVANKCMAVISAGTLKNGIFQIVLITSKQNQYVKEKWETQGTMHFKSTFKQ